MIALAFNLKDVLIQPGSNDYVAYWNEQRVGRLELYDDGGRRWINHIEVDRRFRRRGIGLLLLKTAVADEDAIYAAVGMMARDETCDSDTRHLSEDGAALVTSAVRSGILRKEWCFNPAIESY